MTTSKYFKAIKRTDVRDQTLDGAILGCLILFVIVAVILGAAGFVIIRWVLA